MITIRYPFPPSPHATPISVLERPVVLVVNTVASGVVKSVPEAPIITNCSS